jgi:hypothetical protein
VGEASQFTNGCPVCGYSSGGEKPSTVKTQTTTTKQAVANAQIVQATRKPFLFTNLPLWIYIVTGLSLLIAATALFLTLQ